MKFKNDYQKELYNGLLNLTHKYKEFFVKKIKVENGEFQIFNYAIASYSQFKEDFAKDSRGTMFFVHKDLSMPVELVALPMKKFFSIGEGESNEIKSRNIENAERIFIKEDGSLLTSYVSPVDHELHFKSKNNSDFLNKNAIMKAVNDQMLDELKRAYNDQQICIDMELTSPENRVIKEYSNYTLSILKGRSLKDGSNIDVRSKEFANDFPELAKHLVTEISLSEVDLKRKDVEGYVVEMPNGEMFKIKTMPYLSMVSSINFNKDSNIAANLYNAAVHEMMDEIRSLLYYKNKSDNFPIDILIKQADLVEEYARETFLPMKKTILNFVLNNKDLSDDEFLEKARKDQSCADYMAPIMSLRKGRDFDLETFATKKFGKGANAVYKKAGSIEEWKAKKGISEKETKDNTRRNFKM